MQNESNAIVKIKSSQDIDGSTDEMELICEGSFYCRNGKYFILYNDDETMGNSSTLIKVDGDCVSIKRKGEYSSYFELKKGSVYSFVYHMPYGDMAMEVHTKKAEILLGENGGELALCYGLDAGGSIQTNYVNISVKRKQL